MLPIVSVRIDPATGLLAGNSVPGRLEPFLEGTQPTAEAPREPTPAEVEAEEVGEPASGTLVS